MDEQVRCEQYLSCPYRMAYNISICCQAEFKDCIYFNGLEEKLRSLK
jgi:hypothetical protein